MAIDLQGAAGRRVEVGGHELELKHLDKVYFPEPGTTKGEIVAYYARIAETMLPHIRERGITLKRFPDGVTGESFFEKSCPSHRPDWIGVAPRFTESRGRDTDYCVCNSAAALLWFANIGTLEFHVPLAMRRTPDRPRTVVFDLDPGEGADMLDCCRVALLVRRFCESHELACHVKTSGSKGLQIYLPLNNRSVTFERSKQFAHAVALRLEQSFPDHVVSGMRRSARVGKVLIDWSQNDDNKTTVCVYSVRGKRARPTVSTPVTWSEVADCLEAGDPALLDFEIDDVPERVDRQGDLFAPVLTTTQSLPREL